MNATIRSRRAAGSRAVAWPSIVAWSCVACTTPSAAGVARPHPIGSGLQVSAAYTVDVVRVVSGGVRRTTEILGNVDLLLHADLEPSLGLEDTEAFAYLLANHGDPPSHAVGDLQATDNIEAPESARLFEAWLQRHWADQAISVLAGLYDVNSEFDAMQSASLFVHSSHGIGGELGTSGRNGPSIFPFTSLAARLDVRPTGATYVRAVIADGVPGDPRHPRRTAVRFDDGDGVFVAGELGIFDLPAPGLRRHARTGTDLPGEQHYGDFGRFGCGLWGYTGEFDDFARIDGGGDPVQRTGSFGSYAFFEKRVFYETDDPWQGLSVFVRAGFADDRVQAIDRYVGAGAVYEGLFPGRDADQLGMAVAAARIGDGFANASGRRDDWEIALEFTYRVRLAEGWYLQPDVQYIFDPGGDPTTRDAVVAGLRVVASY